MERWAGRVALVTGAASGIGASTAEKLVKHGMKVIGCDKNTKKIQVQENLILCLNSCFTIFHFIFKIVCL